MFKKSTIWFCTILLITVGSVSAQTDDRALARAQGMLRQINSEKEALEQKITTLQQEFDDYKKEMEQKLDRAQDRTKKVSSSLENWQEGYNELNQNYKNTLLQLAREKQWSAKLENSFEVQTRNFEVCQNNNQNLAKVSNQLLALYEGKSFMDLVKEKEIFTGIKKVDLENFVQDKRYEIADLDLEESAYQVNPVTMPEDDPHVQLKGEEISPDTSAPESTGTTPTTDSSDSLSE